MSALDYVKEHPYMSGGLVIGAVVLFVLLRGGSSGTAATGNDIGSLSAAQLAASTAQQQLQAQGSAAALAAGTQVELAKIGSSRDLSLAGISQTLGLAKINAEQQTTDLANTLTANVAMKQIQGQVDITALNADVTKTQFNTLAQTLIAQAGYQSQTTIAAIQANADVAKSQCHGFGCLF